MRGPVSNVLRLEPSLLVMGKVRKPGVGPERRCESLDFKNPLASPNTSSFGKVAGLSRSLGYADAEDKTLERRALQP